MKLIKSITTKKLFLSHKEIYGEEIYGQVVIMPNTVGPFAREDVIKKYIAGQGKKYTKLHKGQLEFNF